MPTVVSKNLKITMWPAVKGDVFNDKVSMMLGILPRYVEPKKKRGNSGARRYSKEELVVLKKLIDERPRLSNRAIGRLVGVHSSTVDRYRHKFLNED